MLVLSDSLSLAFLDGCACALLAGAGSCRARILGAHITGALVLGCLCGIVGAILREAFLHGAGGTGPIVAQVPGDALAGSLGGVAALYIYKDRGYKIFFWLDAASMGLASAVGAIYALPELGIVAALCLGLINGLAPGLIRDMALGDTAMMVENDWYATAAALGCIVAIAVLMWLTIGWVTEWTALHADEIAVLAGFFIALFFRGWKGQRGMDA